jgi:hypothetical protein
MCKATKVFSCCPSRPAPKWYYLHLDVSYQLITHLMRDILRHRPYESNVAVVSLPRIKNSDETLILLFFTISLLVHTYVVHFD